jgi:hypothetical protein
VAAVGGTGPGTYSGQRRQAETGPVMFAQLNGYVTWCGGAVLNHRLSLRWFETNACHTLGKRPAGRGNAAWWAIFHWFTCFAADTKRGQLADLELRYTRRASC